MIFYTFVLTPRLGLPFGDDDFDITIPAQQRAGRADGDPF